MLRAPVARAAPDITPAAYVALPAETVVLTLISCPHTLYVFEPLFRIQSITTDMSNAFIATTAIVAIMRSFSLFSSPFSCFVYKTNYTKSLGNC